MLFYQGVTLMNYYKWKGIIDYLFALLMLIAGLPIYILIALLIKWQDPKGPVLFKQQRLGKDEKMFTLYKFRSMRVETHRKGIELTDSERLFSVGRFIRKMSLDELPQLINILEGNMSFIGPRPLPKEYLPYYTDQERKRHDVKPGISGWAQVNGRNNLIWEKKFELDVYYTQNMCLLFDTKILLMTIKKVLSGSDVIEYEYDTSKELTDYRSKNRTTVQQQTTLSKYREKGNSYE